MILTPNGFLKVGGVILLLVGVLGYVLPEGELLGENLYFDAAENIAHVVLGIVAILASFVLPDGAKRGLVWIVGIVALVFGVWGFLVMNNPAPNWYGITNLENPLDNIIHLVIGAWALWAAMKKNSPQPMGTMTM